jgi:hypothetical protein
MLHENLLKAIKARRLLGLEKRHSPRLIPYGCVHRVILKQIQVMVHLHEERDVMVLIQLVKGFNLQSIANHYMGVHWAGISYILKAYDYYHL